MLSSKELKLFLALKQKKIREKEGKFLIEGFHLIDECLKSSFRIECIIICEGIKKGQSDNSLLTLISIRKIPVHYVKRHQFIKLCETENSQGLIAVIYKKTPKQLDSISLRSVVVLDKISDPGNLGTIIRTAYWFGIDCIFLSHGSVDIYNSKVIRATQGALFHVNFYENVDLRSELSKLRSNKFEIYLFDLKAEKDLKNTTFSDRNVFVFGNESDGISPEILEMSFEKVKINSFSDCESLNVSVSCGIVLSFYKFAG
jgi:TrmH family RNA methyltransferase